MLQNYLDSSYMLSFVNMEEEETPTVHKNIVFPFPPDDVRWQREILPSHEEERCEKTIRYMLWYWVSNLVNNIRYNFSAFFQNIWKLP